MLKRFSVAFLCLPSVYHSSKTGFCRRESRQLQTQCDLGPGVGPMYSQYFLNYVFYVVFLFVFSLTCFKGGMRLGYQELVHRT